MNFTRKAMAKKPKYFSALFAKRITLRSLRAKLSYTYDE